MRVAVNMSSHARRASIGILFVISLSACRKQTMETAPTPAQPTGVATGAAPTPPDSSRVLATYDEIIRQVEAGDAAFLNISLAAASYLGHLVPGKSIGFYQPDLATPEFKDMVQEVTRRYAFRPVRAPDFRYTCDKRSS